MDIKQRNQKHRTQNSEKQNYDQYKKTENTIKERTFWDKWRINKRIHSLTNNDKKTANHNKTSRKTAY